MKTMLVNLPCRVDDTQEAMHIKIFATVSSILIRLRRLPVFALLWCEMTYRCHDI